MERIVYCHCAFARVVPPATKSAVLTHLSGRDAAFDAVPDLCEMSARRDARLTDIAGHTPVLIVACYERAVRGLFEAAGTPLPDSEVTIVNMRTETPEAIAERIER